MPSPMTTAAPTVLSADYRTQIVNWSMSGSRQDAARPNFIIPPFAWRSKGKSGGFATSVSPEVLWPLRTGNKVRFEELATTSKAGGQALAVNRILECRVGATEVVATRAGLFDVYVIECNIRDLANRGRLVETVRWFYAPAVGHYVLKERLRDGNTVGRIELVSVARSLLFLDDKARAAIDAVKRRALDEAASGEMREWTDETSRTRSFMIILATFSAQGGAFCRRYRLTVQTNARILTIPGIACKGFDGLWRPI